MTTPAEFAQMVTNGTYDHVCPPMPHFVQTLTRVLKFDRCPFMGRHYSNQAELDKSRKTA